MSKITVIIVNWNGEHLLSGCLSGLQEQTFRSFTTILVDNGSTDKSVSFVRQNFPEVRIRELKNNMGFSIANNIAINSVDTEYIALLNNDAIPDNHWLQNLYSALGDHPEAGCAASKMLFSDNPEIIDSQRHERRRYQETARRVIEF